MKSGKQVWFGLTGVMILCITMLQNIYVYHINIAIEKETRNLY